MVTVSEEAPMLPISSFARAVADDGGYVLGGDVSISSLDDCLESKLLSDDNNDTNDGSESKLLFGPVSDCGVSPTVKT